MGEHNNEQAGEHGFTLIELLVTIVIVGVLSAVAIVGVNGLHEKGQTAACSTSLTSAKSATELYYSISGGKFPQSFTDLTNTTTGGQPLLHAPAGVVESARTLRAPGGAWTVWLRRGRTPTDRTTFGGCN